MVIRQVARLRAKPDCAISFRAASRTPLPEKPSIRSGVSNTWEKYTIGTAWLLNSRADARPFESGTPQSSEEGEVLDGSVPMAFEAA